MKRNKKGRGKRKKEEKEKIIKGAGPRETLHEAVPGIIQLMEDPVSAGINTGKPGLLKNAIKIITLLGEGSCCISVYPVAGLRNMTRQLGRLGPQKFLKIF